MRSFFSAFLKPAFLFCFFFCVSCEIKYPYDSSVNLPSEDDKPGFKTRGGEEELSAKSLCRDSSQPVCQESSHCMRICEDVFSGGKREDCYESPEPLVEGFEQVIRVIRKEDFENLDSGILECLLKIDNRKFARTIGELSKSEAMEFLAQVASDKKLARILDRGDQKNFRILKRAFEAISSTIFRAIRTEIKGSFNFLTLAGRHSNSSAYEWMDDLVEEECDESSSCEAAINVYCGALKDSSDSELRKFLRARFFKDAYGKKVERAACGDSHCEYGDPEDFKTFCRNL